MIRRHGGDDDRRDGETEERPRATRPRGLIWNGTISFGLVNIEVTLHSGEVGRELRFTMLDRRDLSPIGYRKINKTTGEDVPPGRIIKGFRRAKDEYVTLTDDDFKRASPERTQRIEILSFVDAGGIDPVYFERPYFLEPSARSEKAYVLLREAMRRAGKAGVATIVLRARQHLAALIPRGPAMLLEILRYHHDLRDPSDLRLPHEDSRANRVSEAELKMAERLIEDLSAPWQPERYKDEYHDELMAFIEAKARTGKTFAGPPSGRPAPLPPPVDLMKLLKRSLAHPIH